MKIKAAAAFALVVIGLAAWYTLLAGTDHLGPARPQLTPEAPLDARGEALARETDRLRRAPLPIAAPQRERDLFRFATAAPRVAAVAPVLPAPALPVLPAGPGLKLIGVAEDASTGSPVRTAIISAPDQLYVVKEGESVAARYGVRRISADVVELVDTSDSSALRLALK